LLVNREGIVMRQDSGTSDGNCLVLSNVSAVYSNIITALRGVSLAVPTGGMVALLGANGAGKTTTLKAISNLLSVERGKVTEGTITYDGKEIQGTQPEYLVQRGIVQVLEGRRCFLNLTVEENLAVAANNARRREKVLIGSMDDIYGHFPKLAAHRKSEAGKLSGGEQQMLTIGRALLAQPKLLLLDEPSMGLAPQIVSQIFDILRTLNSKLGLTILVAEQNARVALKHADFGYVLSNGMILKGGPAAELSQSEDIKRFYLGIGEGDKGSSVRASHGVNIDWMA
jgi:branched-chain amino acid transport system ATP-binding protein